MKKTFIVLMLAQICVAFNAFAQRVEWIKQFGGKGVDQITSFVIDKEGNFIVSGAFQDTIEISGFQLINKLNSRTLFVAKFDTTGKALWVTNTDINVTSGVDSIYIDENNNFYLSHIETETILFHFNNSTGIIDWEKTFNRLANISYNKNNTIYAITELGFITIDLKKQITVLFPNQTIAYMVKGLESRDDNFLFYTNNCLSSYGLGGSISLYNKTSIIFAEDCAIEGGEYKHSSLNINRQAMLGFEATTQFNGYKFSYLVIGGKDIFLTQYNGNDFSKQIGGTGDETITRLEYDANNNIIADISTTEGLVIDTIALNKGDYTITLNNSGTCISAVKRNSIQILNRKVYLPDDGIQYVFGNFIDTLDTLRSHGSSDFYFAKISCKPAFLKKITGVSKACKGVSYTFSTELYDKLQYTWSIDKKGAVQNSGNTASIRFDTTGIYTITVLPTNECGVGNPIYLKVSVSNKPNAVSRIVGDTLVCTGVLPYSIDDTTGVYSWKVSGSGVVVANKNHALVNWNTAGLYSVQVVDSNYCGLGPASITSVIVQSKAEQPNTIKGNAEVCSGSQSYEVETLDNHSYHWYLNNGGIITEKGEKATVNWLNPGKFELLVTARNTCGNSVPRSLMVTVKSVPTRPAPIAGDYKTCVGKRIYYTDKTANASYSWSITGGGVITPKENYAEIDWATIGSYTVKVTQANECGSGAPTSLVVKVLDVPAAVDSIVGLNKVCQGQQLYAVAQRADEEYKWDVTAGGSLLPKSNTATVGWSAAGAYTLSVSPFNQCGTGKSVSKVVTVSAATSQVGAITGKDNPCLSTETYTVNNIAGLTYQWKLDGGGTLTPNANNATVVWSKTGVHSLQLTTSDNCSVSLIAQVIDKPLTPSAIMGNSTVCLGEASYQVEATPSVTYNWKLSDGGKLTPYNNASSITWEKAGMYELQVSASNQCGNSDTSKMQIKALQAPQLPSPISGNDTVCISNELYSITPQADVTYNWWLNNAGGILSINNNKTNVDWQYAHENVLNVSVNNVCGTSAIRSMPVVVKSKPSTALLLGDSLACTGSSVYYVHPQAETQYIWGVQSGGTITPKLDSARVQWTSTGNHIISVTPKNFCGLGQTSLRTIAVNSTPSIAEAIVGKDVSCQGMEFYSVTGKAGLQYAWSVTAGGSLVSLGNSAKIFWTGVGQQNISLTPYNECGLGKALQKTVTVKRIPDSSSAIVGLRSVCLGSQLYSVTAADEVSYSWSLPTGGTISSNKNTATIDWTTKGFHSLLLVPSNMCGAGPSRSITVQVSAIPNKPQFASADTLVCTGQLSRVQVNEQESNTYNWSLATPSAGTISANAAQASIVFKTTGQQSVQLTASNKCGTSEMAEQKIQVKTVPSITTPITGRVSLCLGKAMYHILNSNKNTLTWNINGGGSLSPQGDSAQVDWFTAGQYKISVTPSNECGNGNTQTLVVQTVTKPQQADAIMGINTLCLKTTAELSTSAKTDVSYQWLTDTSGTITSSNNTAKAVYRQGGTHTITLIPSNSCGQGPATTASLQVNEPPRTMSEIFGDSTLCINNNANYAVPIEQGVSYLWTITNNGSINTNNNTATLVANKAGDFQLAVQVKNQCGTVSLPSKKVRVKTVPTAKLNIVGDSVSCLGNKPYRVASNGNTVLWNINGGGAIESSQNTASVNWNSPGTYQISAQENNLCGSGAVATKQVNVIGAPALPVSIEGSVTVCTGSEQQYTTLALANVLYKWEIVGTTLDTAYKAIRTNSIKLSYAKAGSAQIKLSTYNQCGESQKRYLDIAVQAPLQRVPFSIVGDSVLCLNSIETFSTTLVNNFDWRWTIDSSLTHGSFKNSLQVEWSKAGNFTLAATPFNSCGTGDTAFFSVQVEVPLQKPIVEYRRDSLVVLTNSEVLWYKNNALYDEAKSPIIANPIEGNYTVQTKNSCGLSAMSDTAYIAPAQWFTARIFPNPAMGKTVTVELPLNYEWKSFEILNSLGKPLSQHFNTGQSRVTVPIENIPEGIYIIAVKGTKFNISGKFTRLRE